MMSEQEKREDEQMREHWCMILLSIPELAQEYLNAGQTWDVIKQPIEWWADAEQQAETHRETDRLEEPEEHLMQQHDDGSVTLSKQEFDELNRAYQCLYAALDETPTHLGDFRGSREESLLIIKWQCILNGEEFNREDWI